MLLGTAAFAQSKRHPSISLEMQFATNAAQPSPAAKAMIGVLAKALKDPSLAGSRFVIVGYAGPQGSSARNQALSERRAIAVRKILVSEHGFEAGRFDVMGFGLQKPESSSGLSDPTDQRIEIINAGPAQ